MNRYASFLALTLMASLPTASFGATLFQAQDIGDLAGGENYSRAYGMNAYGQIVGESGMSYTPDAATLTLLASSPSNFDPTWSERRGFVWTQGTLSEVGQVTQATSISCSCFGKFARILAFNTSRSTGAIPALKSQKMRFAKSAYFGAIVTASLLFVVDSALAISRAPTIG